MQTFTIQFLHSFRLTRLLAQHFVTSIKASRLINLHVVIGTHHRFIL